MDKSFEELVELLAHARRLAALSDSHAEVMRAEKARRNYERMAVKAGYNIIEVRRKSRDRYLDLTYGVK